MSKTARGWKARPQILIAVLFAALLTLSGGRDRAPGPPVANAAANAPAPTKAQPPSTEIGPEQPGSSIRRDELPRHVGPGLSRRRPLRRAGQPPGRSARRGW